MPWSTAPNVRKVPVTNQCPSGYEAMCVAPHLAAHGRFTAR
jgi:hypothetical protein